MSHDVVELLRELIAVPSVNPRLAPAGDPLAGERRMTEWLARFAESNGWYWARQPVHPDRANFIAMVPGGGDATQLWEVHQDTVGVAGMSIDPFTATVANDRVAGRGACDVKGAMVAMLAALSHVARQPADHRPNILLACTVNEECGFTGARALADIWRPNVGVPPPSVEVDAVGGLSLDQLREHRPDACIVAEPTELNVVVSHRGAVRWQCVAHGRAAHSSHPEQGANAVYAMAEVVRLIEEYHRVDLAALGVDPLCGPSAVCVTTIQGGVGANTVPDRAVIDVDRRLLPDESPETAYHELIAHLAARAELHGCRLEHLPPWMQSRGLASGPNRAWADQVAGAVRATGASCELHGVRYGTNAASIAVAGIPTVVFGPGSIDQAHTADEWIAVDQLHRAVEAFTRIAGAPCR